MTCLNKMFYTSNFIFQLKANRTNLIPELAGKYKKTEEVKKKFYHYSLKYFNYYIYY